MDKNKNIVIINEGGLKCDNPNCDWCDESIKLQQLKEWLNKPCPKCGENVLTLQDYNNITLLQETINLVNNLSEEDLKVVDNNPVMQNLKKILTLDDKSDYEITVDTHEDLKFNIKKIKDDKD